MRSSGTNKKNKWREKEGEREVERNWNQNPNPNQNQQWNLEGSWSLEQKTSCGTFVTFFPGII